MTGDRLLAMDVIRKAMDDMRVGQSDARHFMLDREGAWAQSRTFWCEIADLDPEAAREAALHLLASQN